MTIRVLAAALALLMTISSVLSFGLTAPHALATNNIRNSALRQHDKYMTTRCSRPSSSLHMLFEDMDPNMMYAGMALATIVPSVLFVSFVGKAADNSRDTISTESRDKFKRKMMDTPGINLAVPTSDEEALKKQIALAYMKDKDVDVAVLEQKLLKRAQWRKEMMAKAKTEAASYEDDEGW